jgi:hypothetical protein
MMRAWRSAFLIGGFAAALGLSLLGCAVAPLEDDEAIGEVESGLDTEPSGEPDGSSPADDDLDPGPDPIPWKPSSAAPAAEQGEPDPGASVTGPDPIPWMPGTEGGSQDEASSSGR